MSSTTDASQFNKSEAQDSRTEYECVSFNGVIDTDVLDVYLRHMEELFDEYTILINRCGWHIKVMDSASVVQMYARIHTDDWEQYDLTRSGPIAVSQKTLEEMTAFVEGVDGHAHVTIDDGTIEFSDASGRLFIEEPLIDPRSVRDAPNLPQMNETTSITIGNDNDDMWPLTKWIRENKGSTSVHMDVNKDCLTLDVRDNNGNVEDRHEVYGRADSRTDVETKVGMQYCYQILKNPLKAQLTDAPYTFTFTDEGPLKFSREYESQSKLTFTLAPRRS